MAIPSVNLKVSSGGLGIILPGGTQLPANIAGWCSQGPAGVPTTFGPGAAAAVQATFGVGNAVDLACSCLTEGAGSVVITRMYHGAMVASVTQHSGTIAFAPSQSGGSPAAPYGTPTATGSTGPIIKIGTGGALGTATFSWSLDGGATYSAVQTTPAGGVFVLPNTGITLTFSGTFTSADAFASAITTAVGSSSAVIQLGPNGVAPQGAGLVSMDALNNPQDAYNVIVLIVATGAIGVGQYSASIDGGRSFGPNTLIPSSNPTGLGAGIQIDWANTGGAGGGTAFQAGDTYQFTTQGPAYTLGDMVTVTNLIQGNATQWDWIHFVGRPATVSAATAFFSALDSQMSAWFSAQRYSFGVMETPADSTASNIDASLIAAFANLASDFVSVGAGDCAIISPVSSALVQRNAAWAATIQGSRVGLGIDLSAPKLGNLSFVNQLFRDENVTQGLDAAGFTTLRSWNQFQGYFLTNARIKCAPTSDIVYFQSRRVLNAACRVAYAALVLYVSSDLPVSVQNGTLTQQTATAIQNFIMREINTALQGAISGSSVTVDTTADVLSTGILSANIGVIPKFYPKQINATIGYVNPALSSQ